MKPGLGARVTLRSPHSRAFGVQREENVRSGEGESGPGTMKDKSRTLPSPAACRAFIGVLKRSESIELFLK